MAAIDDSTSIVPVSATRPTCTSTSTDATTPTTTTTTTTDSTTTIPPPSATPDPQSQPQATPPLRPLLTATYTSPTNAPFILTHALPPQSSATTSERVAYLARLRAAVEVLQAEVNEELTERMGEDLLQGQESVSGKKRKDGVERDVDRVYGGDGGGAGGSDGDGDGDGDDGEEGGDGEGDGEV